MFPVKASSLVKILSASATCNPREAQTAWVNRGNHNGYDQYGFQQYDRRQQRRPRIVRDRLNPLDYMDDADLHAKFRFVREHIFLIIGMIHNVVAFTTQRGCGLSSSLQVLIALRFYTTGTFQDVIGELVGVTQVTDFLDIFGNKDVTSILKNKFVVVIGDSIQRGIYKDLVLMLQNDRYLAQRELRSKGEFSFLGDELIEGGQKDKMTNGISYKEVRQYHTNVHLVRFYFMTRCYNSYMETILRDLKEGPTPDVIIMNSCLWDITRYGADSIKDYKENLEKLFNRFLQSLPDKCLVIWTTTLPISSSARGGFLVPEIEFMSTTLRLDILEANFYAKLLATEHGFDVLDLHFYLRHYLHCRVKDGIHWDMMAHRYITNLLMSHVCDAWGITMPAKTSRTFGSYGSVAGAQRRYEEWTNSQGNPHGNFGNRVERNNRSRENVSSNRPVNSKYRYNNFEPTNNGNQSYPARNGPYGKVQTHSSWNGPYDNAWTQPVRNGPYHRTQTQFQPATSLGTRNNAQDYSFWTNSLNFGNTVLNALQNFQWQSYEENSYHAHALNRRQTRRHPNVNNPYSRSRWY